MTQDKLTPDTRPELRKKIDKIISQAITADLVDGRYGSQPYTDQILSLCEKEIEKQGYDKGFDDGCVFNVYEAKKQERERIISQIEQMDKRHTIEFVLRVLKAEVKETNLEEG